MRGEKVKELIATKSNQKDPGKSYCSAAFAVANPQ
jgi:hypothetical protein